MPVRPARIHSFRRNTRRTALLAGASAVAFFSANPEALAKPIGNWSAAPSAAAIAAAQSGSQEAARAARDANNALKRATLAIQAMQSTQQAARDAARAALNAMPAVPNGLGGGGLQVGAGVIGGNGTVDQNLWQGANLPTQFNDGDRTKVDVNQTQQKAILTWDTFNVGAKTDLNFNQHGNANWAVLNRVLSTDAKPSQILGSIKADGAVYVINRNGIIFGGTSQVNVGSLIASSLDIHGGAIEYQAGATEQQRRAARNLRFLDGILAANPASNRDVPLTFFDGTDMNALADRTRPGETFAAYDGVTVEAGARIGVGTYGQAVLLGHNVVNRGRIDAPDGQVLLAAGRGILLLDGTKRAPVKLPTGEEIGGQPIRGFLAGVDRGGFAENSGLIVTERGNITLTGKNVSQNGVLISTTAAETAGSILIQAETGMRGTSHTRNLAGMVNNLGSTGTEGMFPFVDGERGAVSFGEGSYAAILPDLSGEKVVGNPYKPSTVEVYGNSIVFEKDATLYVPAGEIKLVAKKKNGQTSWSSDDSRIYLAAGAVLDVSGLRDVEIAMEQNTIRAELRANELSDNPVMRDSSLRGTSVYFDARYGTKLTDGTGVADLSGYYDLIERDVTQFMTVGGRISMTGMEIIAREGSVIDLSGGSVRYLDGYVQSTLLVTASGARVPIEMAQAGVVYVAVERGYIRQNARWGITEQWTSFFSRSGRRFERGYTEGRSAGSLLLNNVDTATANGESISADAIRIFDGDVVADIVVGERQTDPSTGAGVTDVTRIWRERPKLATLNIGTAYRLGTANDANPIGGSVVIGGNGPILGADVGADTALVDYTDLTSLYQGVEAHRLVLPSDWFNGSTFGDVTLISGGGQNGVLTISEGTTVDVGAFGSFTFIGRQAEIDGTIRAAGGKVRIEALRSTSPAGSSSIAWDSIPEAERPSIHLGETGIIDVAGRWTNARAGAAGMPVLDGGKVELISRSILLDKGSLIDASGGAHLSADGKITPGDGGSILIDTATPYISTNSPASGPANGRLEMNGDIVAYALGRGGSLTIDTPDDVHVSDHTVSFADGVLPGGVPAPRDMTLVADVIIRAGEILPADAQYVTDILAGGEIAPVFAWASDWSNPIVAGPNFVVPPGMYFGSDNWRYYYSGATVPAGTQLVEYGIDAGYRLPADLFPNGLRISPTTVTQAAGTIATRQMTIAAGTAIRSGAVFSSSVQIEKPRVFTSDFFTEGGFSSYALSGARGMTVTSGTVIAPNVDTMVLGNGVFAAANGARLYDLLDEQNGVLLRNSSELPEGLQAPMELSLGTAPLSLSGTIRPVRVTGAALNSRLVTKARHPGKLVVETGAEIRMEAESTVRLDSLVDVFFDGMISTPGGTIHILPNEGEPYMENASVRLGANARLLAGGYQKAVPGPNGWRRSVEAGGMVQISGAVPGKVLIDRQAVIDVSGVHGIADLDRGGAPALSRGYAPVMIDGAAGSISISATYGVIAGDLRLSPGGANGYGGTLSISAGAFTPQLSALVIGQAVPAEFGEVTEASPTSGYTSLRVSADLINRSGADDLVLQPGSTTYSQGLIFDGDVTLATRRSITLGTAYISTGTGVSTVAGSVTLASSYVNLVGATNSDAGNPAPAGTDGRLTIRADLIDISGTAKIGGFGETSFVAAGDIRLAGNFAVTGSLTSAGSLSFDAAQVYVTPGRRGPYSDDSHELPETDPGFLVSSDRSITIRSNGRPAPVPLSYGQRLPCARQSLIRAASFVRRRARFGSRQASA